MIVITGKENEKKRDSDLSIVLFPLHRFRPRFLLLSFPLPPLKPPSTLHNLFVKDTHTPAKGNDTLDGKESDVKIAMNPSSPFFGSYSFSTFHSLFSSFCFSHSSNGSTSSWFGHHLTIIFFSLPSTYIPLLSVSHPSSHHHHNHHFLRCHESIFTLLCIITFV